MEESFWKQTYEKILIGMGLFGITLKFLFLNQILPFIGALLLFTGFRKLRSENRWLKAGYAGAALGTVTVKLGDETLGEIPVTAAEGVERLSLGFSLRQILKGLFQL